MNYFIVEYFFDYYEYILLKQSKHCFIDEWFEHHCKASLLVRDEKDFASPNFSNNQEIIGYSYKNYNNIKNIKII